MLKLPYLNCNVNLTLKLCLWNIINKKPENNFGFLIDFYQIVESINTSAKLIIIFTNLISELKNRDEIQ